MTENNYTNVDEYISMFPKEIQDILEKIRATIRKTAPEAQEEISYRMPAYRLNGSPLVYFAAFKNHIGFYPTGSGIAAFQEEIAGYKSSKGAVQFPIDKPMPLDLIVKMTKFKVEENAKKAKGKK